MNGVQFSFSILNRLEYAVKLLNCGYLDIGQRKRDTSNVALLKHKLANCKMFFLTLRAAGVARTLKACVPDDNDKKI